MRTLVSDLLNIFFALVRVLINGFFVAVEFALVKLREGRLDKLVDKQRPFAKNSALAAAAAGCIFVRLSVGNHHGICCYGLVRRML
jgi:hypothetical protein